MDAALGKLETLAIRTASGGMLCQVGFWEAEHVDGIKWDP